MATYLDPLMDHGWIRGPSCHMWADSADELHAFAAKIGLKRQWAQRSRCYRLLHYDLTEGRRKAALAKGAVCVTRQQAVAMWRGNSLGAVAPFQLSLI